MLLNHAQELGLKLDRHFANFIEEKRTAIGGLKRPILDVIECFRWRQTIRTGPHTLSEDLTIYKFIFSGVDENPEVPRK